MDRYDFKLGEQWPSSIHPSPGRGTGSISMEVMRLAPCSRESSKRMEPSANLHAGAAGAAKAIRLHFDAGRDPCSGTGSPVRVRAMLRVMVLKSMNQFGYE